MRWGDPRRVIALSLMSTVMVTASACAGASAPVTATVTQTVTVSAGAQTNSPSATTVQSSPGAALPEQLAGLIDALNSGDITRIESLTEPGSAAQEWSKIMAACRVRLTPPIAEFAPGDLGDGSVGSSGLLADFTFIPSGVPVSESFTAVSGEATVEDATVKVTGAAAGKQNTWYLYTVTNNNKDTIFVEFFGFSSGDSVLPWDFQYAQEVPTGKSYEGCLSNPKPNPSTGDLSVRWNLVGTALQTEKTVALVDAG